MTRPRRPAGVRSVIAAAMAAMTAAVARPAAPQTAGRSGTPAAPESGDSTVVVVPGRRYAAGPLRRLLAGDNHRELWLRPLRVPVLDLDRFAGGLEPDHASGNQSRTLHLTAPDGRTYIFRSTDKFVVQVIPEDLRHTWLHDLAQDHVSVFHPSAGLVVPALHEALGLLAVPARLRVMPDDPRLGEHREAFAGMLGLVVERPNEADDGRPLYGGYAKIVGTDELLEKLEEDPRNRVDAREYLASRFIDFVVGDTDRGPDQWRWAREPVAVGVRWRPIARDRDWAFVHADGVLARVARTVFPKLVRFQPEIPDVDALTFADRGLGRRLLTTLDRDAWDAVVREVRDGLDDGVIDRAVALLPPEHQPGHAAELAAALKARREQLPRAAAAFYARLAGEVDVRATDRGDRAEITRGAGGEVRVTVTSLDEDGPGTYFDRTFRPEETREVRVYLHGGDDEAVVRGDGPPGITVRVIGGGGDDRIEDRTAAGAGTALYDGRGSNRLAGRPGTRVDTRRYREPEPPEDFFAYQLGRRRDWGTGFTWLDPALDHGEDAGIIIGGGPTWTEYGFRRYPFASRVSLKALYGTASGGFALDAVAERRAEGRPLGLRVHARASQLEAVRFFGYGNDTPPAPRGVSLVTQDRLVVDAALELETGPWEGAIGPVLRWTDPDVPAENPAIAAPGGPAPGAGVMTEVGARGELRYRRVDRENVPTRGIDLDVRLSGWPGVDGGSAHGSAGAEARAYLPAPVPGSPVLAVRAGGRVVRGDAPIHDLARVGGRTTLRGYPWQRFAGDAALYGAAELRVPVVRANLGLARGRLGVLGLVDAGRVYHDGGSPGGWHTAHGAGVYFATLHTAVHLVWARGEEDKLYAGLGVPF